MNEMVVDGVIVLADWEISEENASRYVSVGKTKVDGLVSVSLRRRNANCAASFNGEEECHWMLLPYPQR